MSAALPRMPVCQHKDVQHQRRYIGDVYTADQMQAYASQARADLEAENADLKRKLEEARALLQGIVETAADMAQAALKETP